VMKHASMSQYLISTWFGRDLHRSLPIREYSGHIFRSLLPRLISTRIMLRKDPSTVRRRAAVK
jgi:hypothetical protein